MIDLFVKNIVNKSIQEVIKCKNIITVLSKKTVIHNDNFWNEYFCSKKIFNDLLTYLSQHFKKTFKSDIVNIAICFDILNCCIDCYLRNYQNNCNNSKDVLVILDVISNVNLTLMELIDNLFINNSEKIMNLIENIISVSNIFIFMNDVDILKIVSNEDIIDTNRKIKEKFLNKLLTLFFKIIN